MERQKQEPNVEGELRDRTQTRERSNFPTSRSDSALPPNAKQLSALAIMSLVDVPGSRDTKVRLRIKLGLYHPSRGSAPSPGSASNSFFDVS